MYQSYTPDLAGDDLDFPENPNRLRLELEQKRREVKYYETTVATLRSKDAANATVRDELLRKNWELKALKGYTKKLEEENAELKRGLRQKEEADQSRDRRFEDHHELDIEPFEGRGHLKVESSDLESRISSLEMRKGKQREPESLLGEPAWSSGASAIVQYSNVQEPRRKRMRIHSPEIRQRIYHHKLQPEKTDRRQLLVRPSWQLLLSLQTKKRGRRDKDFSTP
ncbi:MAG: hypothetical protein L6R40_003581 [Gallowayella cf. fulva]|nr:MAG: hypothetical protein L6R40_003581 [Xanthomendoza cf. fulva]